MRHRSAFWCHFGWHWWSRWEKIFPRRRGRTHRFRECRTCLKRQIKRY